MIVEGSYSITNFHLVDIVSRVENPGILFFKYYNHSKTDHQKPSDEDYDAWAYSTCKEMMDLKGDFVWSHLQSSSGSSSAAGAYIYLC